MNYLALLYHKHGLEAKFLVFSGYPQVSRSADSRGNGVAEKEAHFAVSRRSVGGTQIKVQAGLTRDSYARRDGGGERRRCLHSTVVKKFLCET